MWVRVPGQSSRLKQWGWCALVFGLVLACYWPALRGGILWDDPAHIPRPELRSWEGLGKIWTQVGATQQYYPVLFSSFWLEHRMWGDHTLGYHLVNILLHATSCCLLAFVLRKLWATPTADAGDQRLISPNAAWLVALIFAVHPMCVESVAWITEQKNTLSLVFYLSAGLAYLNFCAKRQSRTYLIASAFFLLALGSKTSTVTLPAALLVVLWWKNDRLDWRRDVVPLIPWFVAAIVIGLFTSWVERKWIGAEGVDFELSFLQRGLLASRVLWFYVGKLVWPLDLNFFYPRWDVAAESPGWIGYLGAGAIVTIGLWLLRQRYRGLLAGWLLFAGSLFPILGFFKVFFFLFSYVNDHFLYLASLGFIATAVGGIAWLLAPAPVWARQLAGAAGVSILITLAVLTHRQSALYVDNITLFRATVTRNPDTWMGHHILGFALAKSPSPELRAQATGEYEAALRLNPTHPDAHLGLAIEFAKMPGRKADAITHLERAIELRPLYAEAHAALAGELADEPSRVSDALQHGETAVRLKPDYAPAHNNLGYVLAKLPGRLAEAIAQYQEAVQLKPDYSRAYLNLANALAATPGRGAEAVTAYEKSLQLDPDSPAAHFNLANTLAHWPGRAAEAVPHYETALQLDPNFADAHANLANTLGLIGGHEADALSHYEAALRIKPDSPFVHYNLALLLSRLPNRHADAVNHGEEAVRLKPDYLEAYNGLAIIYAQQGQLGQSKRLWEKSLQLDPNYEAARKNLLLLEQMEKSSRR